MKWFFLLIVLSFGYAVRAELVVINEIYYNSPSGDAREEFIELYNPNEFPVDLTQAQFVQGISFTFPSTSIPPKGYLVVAADVETFHRKFPEVPAVGSWEGKLGNRGETLRLVDVFYRELDHVEYGDDGEWAVRSRGPMDFNHTGWIWSAAHDGGGKSLELTGTGISNEYGQLWEASLVDGGTPGAANSVSKPALAPVILQTMHRPAVPEPQDSVTVSAVVIDDSPAGVNVYLHHRVDGTPQFSVTPMFDDGKHGDQIAGDGVYGAILPPAPDKTIVEFYVRAVDGEGNARAWPRFVQPDNAPLANLLYQVSATPPRSDQPFHRLIMTKKDRDEFIMMVTTDHQSNARMNGAFVSSHNGQYEVRYQVGIRNRGQGSRFISPNNFRVEFTGDSLWRDMEKININADKSGIQVLGSAVAQNAGFFAGRSRLAEVRLNDQDFARTGASMFGFYAQNEMLDAGFMDENLLGSANLYRGSRSNPHEADLYYRGNDPDLYRHVYFKETNESEDDWSDLIELTRVLTLAPDSEYVNEVARVIDVDQWLRYFVFNSLVANSETSLGNGWGDDYYLYADQQDGRFCLIPYDHDSFFGQGYEALPPETPVFTAIRTQVITRFLTQPEFAARYYEIMLEALDGWFTESNLFPLINQVLDGRWPEVSLHPINEWITRRREFLRDAIPESITIFTTNLVVRGEGFEVSAPSISLTGRANPVSTTSVFVNGMPAAWSVWKAEWNVSNLALRPGPNRILVQAFDSSGHEVDRAFIEVFHLGSIEGTIIDGPLLTDTTLTRLASPYQVTSDLVVAENVTLTIEPGATIFFNPGVDLTVRGSLRAAGSASGRIRMTAIPGESNVWGGIRFLNAFGTNELSFLDLDFTSTDKASIEIENSVVHLHNSSWAHTGQAISFRESSLWIEDCHFPTTTNASIIAGTASSSAGYLMVTNNFFSALKGDGKAIAVLNSQVSAVILECYNNLFLGGESSGIELHDAGAHVEGNRFTNFHPIFNASAGQNAPAVISASGQGRLTASRNIFSDVSQAISLSGTAATVHHNSFIDSSGGIFFAGPMENYPSGYAAELIGNIFSAVAVVISGTENLSNPSALHVEYCLFPGGQLRDGLGNSEGDARLTSGFHLAPGSAGLKRGRFGRDMGAYTPASLSIDPVPPSSSADSNQAFSVWGPGFTHYRYRLNDGPISNPMELSAPLLLTGLTEGPQRLSVIGRNSAGRWQQNESAAVFEWTVTPGALPVVLNEVFAGELSAPADDWIELYNVSGNNIDLSGYSISDDPTIPRKFVFPSGTIIAARSFLRISGDAVHPAIRFGFGIDQVGDTIYLYAPPQFGTQTLLDSVTFGAQLSSYSIGRVDGEWVLTELTPGAANKRAQVGDVLRVLINEWYTTGSSDNDPDFIELFNPEPFPVSLGGVGLSDQPTGSPYAHLFPPLTFMAPGSVEAFIASGTPTAGPAHLPFKLSREQGAISLTAPGGELIDWIWYGPQSVGISEGRPANNQNSFSFFPVLTMGVSNPIKTSPTNLPAFTIIPWDAQWSYDQSGEPQPATWAQPAFDSSTWQVGKALFASGVGPLAQPIHTTPDLEAVTFYFRTQFDLSLLPDAAQLYAIIDDGAVVYLNGHEVLRLGMGAAPVSHETLSERYVVAPSVEGPFGIPKELFKLGINTLAVEVHQVTPSSRDLAFGIFLRGVNSGATPSQHVRLNEILADNRSFPDSFGQHPSWVELYNPSSIDVDLSGMALSDDLTSPRKWVLPNGLLIPSQGYLVVPCHFSGISGTSAKNPWVSGGTVYLFDRADNGNSLVDAVTFGFQPPDFSLGRHPIDTSKWKLGVPTPGALNQPAATASPRQLTINEWLAQSSNGEDWLEIFNPTDLPVDLSGLRLSEDWQDPGKMVVAPYSFIGTGVFAYKVLVARGDDAQASDEAPFKLSKDGEAIILSDSNGTIIDTILFGRQTSNVSQGRFPDGSSAFAFFSASISPNAPNYLDTDRDGLPDAWETQYGFDPSVWADSNYDPDEDGFTNLQEFHAGTDPLDFDSFLIISSGAFSSQGVQLRFQAEAGRAYSVQTSSSLGTSNWEEEVYLPARQSPGEVSVTLQPGEAPNRFFRVQAIPPSVAAAP